MRAQGPLGNTRMGFGPIIGDGVTTQMKTGNTLQQLDSVEDTQKPSLEIGFGNWVWALFGPPNLSVGLRVCLHFITIWLLDYFLIIIDFYIFYFYFTEFAH